MPVSFSQRAKSYLDDLREDFDWALSGHTYLINYADEYLVWWSFAGKLVNSAVAGSLCAGGIEVKFDDLSISFPRSIRVDEARSLVHLHLNSEEIDQSLHLDEKFIQSLKFSECLPDFVSRTIIAQRFDISESLRILKKMPLRVLKTSTE